MQDHFRNFLGPVVWPVARRLTAGGARVLMYHRFGAVGAFRRLDVSSFENHLRHLRRHFRPRPLSEVVARLRDGRAMEPNTVVLTVDDGYRDFYEVAYPLLERYRIPACVFLASEFVAGRMWLWFDAIHYLVHASSRQRTELDVRDRRMALDLSSHDARNVAWESMADLCLPMSKRDRCETLARLEEATGVRLPPSPTPPYAGLGWEQVHATDPALIEYGSHTRTHPILTGCGDGELHEELSGSKADLEAALDRPIRYFCYPYGRPGDYDPRTEAAVRAAGYEAAVVAHGALVFKGMAPFRIERLPTPADAGHFRSAVDGLDSLRAGRWQ